MRIYNLRNQECDACIMKTECKSLPFEFCFCEENKFDWMKVERVKETIKSMNLKVSKGEMKELEEFNVESLEYRNKFILLMYLMAINDTKIKEIENDSCGDCPIIDYCGEPFTELRSRKSRP